MLRKLNIPLIITTEKGVQHSLHNVMLLCFTRSSFATCLTESPRTRNDGISLVRVGQ